MTWDQITGNWEQFKGRVKQQCGQLTDDVLTLIEGRRDELVGRIDAKDQAEKGVREWENRLR